MKIKLNSGEEITLITKPTEKTIDLFIEQRISPAEVAQIESFLTERWEDYQKLLHHRANYDAIHVRSRTPDAPDLLRSFFIFKCLDDEKNLSTCVVMPFKKHLANGREIRWDEKNKDKIEQLLIVGKGGHRTVKFALHENKSILAETISRRQNTHELEILLANLSPFINKVICYSDYPKKNGELVRVIVAPYHPNGHPVSWIPKLTDLEKNRIILQLFLGFRDLQRRGWCPEDISNGNWLIRQDKTPCIIDLEDAHLFLFMPACNHSVTTYFYESPEFHIKTSLYDNLTKKRESENKPTSLASQLHRHFPEMIEKIENPFNHFANAIWGLGIIAFNFSESRDPSMKEFLFGRFGNILGRLAFFMLNPKRLLRPTIAQSIEYLLKSFAVKNVLSKKLKTVKELFENLHDLFEGLPNTMKARVLLEIENTLTLSSKPFNSEKLIKNLYPEIDIKQIKDDVNFELEFKEACPAYIAAYLRGLSGNTQELYTLNHYLEKITWFIKNSPAKKQMELKEILRDFKPEKLLLDISKAILQNTNRISHNTAKVRFMIIYKFFMRDQALIPCSLRTFFPFNIKEILDSPTLIFAVLQLAQDITEFLQLALHALKNSPHRNLLAENIGKCFTPFFTALFTDGLTSKTTWDLALEFIRLLGHSSNKTPGQAPHTFRFIRCKNSLQADIWFFLTRYCNSRYHVSFYDFVYRVLAHFKRDIKHPKIRGMCILFGIKAVEKELKDKSPEESKFLRVQYSAYTLFNEKEIKSIKIKAVQKQIKSFTQSFITV